LPEDILILIANQIVEAISSLQNEAITHLELCPDLITLNSRGEVKLGFSLL